MGKENNEENVWLSKIKWPLGDLQQLRVGGSV
jgi:hypothetical protein